jgi:hypothetical protein
MVREARKLRGVVHRLLPFEHQVCRSFTLAGRPGAVAGVEQGSQAPLHPSGTTP